MADRALLYRYRGNCCAGCGKSIPEMVKRYGTFNRIMEFHHVDPKSKDKNYENLIRQKISTKQIEEVEKCVLLCRECHGVQQAQGIRGKMELSIELEGRKITQTLNGGIIYDAVDNEMRFLTNERLMLQVFRVEVSGQPTKLFSGVEIEEDRYFTAIFQNLTLGQSVEVYNESRTELNMRAECIGDKEIKMTQAVGFPFFEIQWNSGNQDSPILWYRNGAVLTKSGNIITEGVLNIKMKLN